MCSWTKRIFCVCVFMTLTCENQISDGSNDMCDSNNESGNDVTLVSAFFDIGRGNYKHYRRSAEVYFANFKKWTRIKNRLIVFCQNEVVRNKILDIRIGFGLGNKTEVVIIDDIFSIEHEIFLKMVEISKDPNFLNFRLDKTAPENRADYNYIMYMKFYFMNEINLNYNITTQNIGWIDFGFNHGGRVFLFEEDFSFDLECELTDRVSLFYRFWKVDERPMFEIVRNVQPDSIMGSFIICPRTHVNTFWTIVKKCVCYFLHMGFIDDDQVVLLLATRLEPDLFRLRKSTWCLPIKQYCNGKHMRINPNFVGIREHFPEFAKAERVNGKKEKAVWDRKSVV